MQAIVVSNTESLRTQYFIKAGQDLGIDTAFVSYDDLLLNPSKYQDKLIKLEPPEHEEFEIARYNVLNAEYKELLSFIAENEETRKLNFLNRPEAILRTLDKLNTKILLSRLSQTPMLNFESDNLNDLIKLMDETSHHAVFIKPRFGSGAGGIIALRKKPGDNKLVAYTSIIEKSGKMFNTNRLNRLSNKNEIEILVNFILQSGVLFEEWISKEKFQEQPFDLRVVCQFGKVKYIVVRCGKVAITNLHLNNNAISFDKLQLSKNCTKKIVKMCIETNKILELTYSGIDILIAKGTETPYIIEVNGQGDHIYQDIFEENSIYKEQLFYGGRKS